MQEDDFIHDVQRDVMKAGDTIKEEGEELPCEYVTSEGNVYKL